MLSVSPAIQLQVALSSGANGQVDLGTVVHYLAVATGGTAPYNYSWDFGDSTTGSGPNPTHTYAGTGTYLISVVVTDVGGGISSNTSSVTVVPLPTLTISASPSNVTDVNVSIAFAASVAGGTTPGNSSWTFGDGSSAWGATVDHEYAAAGVYFATFHYRDGSGVNVSRYLSVLVNSALSAKLTVATVPPNSAVTTGTLLQFNTSISGGTQPYSVFWALGDGSYGSGISSQHSYAEAGTYLVTLIVNDSAGAGWSTTYRLVVAAAPGPSALGTQFETGLLLGLLVGAAVAALILFIAPRSKRRPPPSPPTAYVPPADPADGPAWREG